MADPEVHVDWEHSNVKLNFYCSCGRSGRLETNRAQYIQCEGCGKIFRMAGLLPVHRIFVNTETETVTLHEQEQVQQQEPTEPSTNRPKTVPDCFCCSCPEYGGVDPYCRNHGWAGTRPCEIHESPGMADETDKMPVSVQQYLGEQRRGTRL